MWSPSLCSWANITNIIMNITTCKLYMIIIIIMNTVSKSLLMWSPLCSCTNKSTPAPSLHLIQNSKQGIVILFKLAYFRTIVGHKLSHMKRSRQELTREDQSRLTLFLFPQGQRGNHHHVRDKEDKWTQQLMIEHRAMSWCGPTTNIHALHFTSESAFDPSNNIITTKICFVNYKNTIFTFTSFFYYFWKTERLQKLSLRCKCGCWRPQRLSKY